MKLNKKQQAEYDELPNSYQKKKYIKEAKQALADRFGANRKEKKEEKDARISNAVPKSIAEMQGDIAKALEEYDVDPLRELLKYAKKAPKKESASIYKFLMPYIHAQKKSIDIQSDMKMNVTVTMQSFADASQQALNAEIVDLDDDEYTEFEKELMDD